MGTAPLHSTANEIPLIQHPGASRTGIFAFAWLLGLLAILPAAAQLWQLWRNDPLRSVGGLLFAASLALTVWCWSKIDWEDRGTALGILPIAVAAFLARVGAQGFVEYVTPTATIQVLQPSIMLFLTGVGVALLTGGARLVRAAIFPLGLLLLANPVPHAFSDLVDLRLQFLSAQTARHFAHMLGLYPNGQDLLMMFTPHFGMTIVPGCNGVRGAVTMAYLALVLGWIDRFPAWRIATYSVAALLLGYALNLLRLCLLVLYYWAGMHHPSWQKHGATVDYIIGGVVFCIFAGIFSFAFFQKTHTHNHAWSPRPYRPAKTLAGLACVAVLAVIQLSLSGRALSQLPAYTSVETVASAVPQQAGAWHLQRTWAESDSSHTYIFNAEYSSPSAALPVRLGLWLSPVQHFALMSEQAHGRRPDWTGSSSVSDIARRSIPVSTYGARNDSGTPYYVAETTCRLGGCTAHVAGFRKRGWAVALQNAGSGKRLVITARVVGTQDGAVAEPMVRDLFAHLDLQELVEKAGTY